MFEGDGLVNSLFDKKRKKLGAKMKWAGYGPDGYGLYSKSQYDDIWRIDEMACVFDASQKEAVFALCSEAYGGKEGAIEEELEMKRRLEALPSELSHKSMARYFLLNEISNRIRMWTGDEELWQEFDESQCLFWNERKVLLRKYPDIEKVVYAKVESSDPDFYG